MPISPNVLGECKILARDEDKRSLIVIADSLRQQLPLIHYFPGEAHRYTLGAMHILLTGASGFLGGVCAELLAQQKDVRVSTLRSGSAARPCPITLPGFDAPSSLSPDELGSILKDVEITHIIHVGALSSPEVCEREPERARAANVAFTEMLSRFAASNGIHLTTVSTDLVFDGKKAPSDGFSETEPPAPRSVYAQTKVAAEQATLVTSSHAVVRLALIYGHSPSESKGVLGWMERAFAECSPVALFEDEFRTPIHVRDAATAVIEISRRELQGIWHCGGPERISRVTFGHNVAAAFGFDASLIHPSTRASHTALPARPEDVSLCSDKLWSEMRRKPLSVEEALLRYDTR